MKIIVDAMGGDHAPGVVVEGAVEAVKEYKEEIVLVGEPSQIEPVLKRFEYPKDKIFIYPARETILMHELPAISVRKKKGSSIVVGINLIKELKGDAFFSAGNTGAVVCAASMDLGLLPGVERPGIALVIPTIKGISLIIDVGANINPKPLHLLQYGIMGSAYLESIFNKPQPTVGLLNVGEEETKGTDFVKETYDLLSKSNLNFIGNIEGKSIFSGKCDVIVCDGFVGNVALKVMEGAVETMQFFLKRYLLKTSLKGKIGFFLIKDTFSKFKKDLNYAEYGGATLLGVNGVVIIGHGRSNARAVKNAIRVAIEEVKRKINQRIIEAITHLKK
ncbi:MAG: phosphate acyltransferase PlsX [Candidatus Omnitrophica bacterium]|nr:phosphate acyltransferase PlsX [Candidatus Omnitrophota bacterium]